MYTVLEAPIRVRGIVSAFEYRFQKDFRFAGESHEGWEFVYVDSGKIIAKADAAEYVIKSGELICHKPMEYHSLNPYQADATAILFCFYCDSEKMDFFNNKIFTLNARQRNYLYDIAEQAGTFFVPKDPLKIAEDGCMEKDPRATDIQAQFIKNTIELLIMSLFSAKSTKIPLRASLYENHIKKIKLTENIREYLQSNLGSPVCLQDIATAVSYSLSTVKTVFKAETGMGIMQYYNRLRLDTAKKLLAENTYSIGQIAEILGFNDASHFINFFKKSTGISPRNYRQE